MVAPRDGETSAGWAESFLRGRLRAAAAWGEGTSAGHRRG
jgi:hypothetical protein